jgi:uncharacterized protein (DUF427 family)
MTVQCLPKDIKIAPHEGRVTVVFDGKIIADTTRAIDLAEPGNPLRIYIPRDDVTAEVLAASTHQTMCPYKGDASYHSLKSAGARAENAVWYYPDPCPLVEPIRDHLAFWGSQIAYVTE